MEKQRVLHLTIKRKWFDMIASGEKKEEYRELKEYWRRRLFNEIDGEPIPKMFDIVLFRNGYSKDSPTVSVECKGIEIRHGMTFLGAKRDTEYFVIKLGKVLINTSIN